MTQARQHIDNLRTEKLKKLEDSEFRGMVETLTNPLSDPAHLIPELLQNAEDAGAAHVRIQLDENRMLFQHDGAKFEKNDEKDDVGAVCGMCQSTKRGSLDYIGTFGVGFKSTFAVSRNPEIHSGGYSFRFDEETVIVPEWIELEEACGEWNVTIVLPLKGDEHAYESVLKQLEGFEEHGAKPVIFLSKLKRISIRRNGTETLFEKAGVEVAGLKRLGDSFGFAEIKKNGSPGKRFCVYTLKRSIPPELLKHVKKKRRLKLDGGHRYETSVKIAFEIANDGHAVSSTEGLLNAFLPTRIRTFLAFEVNAGFLLSPDREKLESGEDRYNCWLLERAVEAVEDIIESYKEKAPKEFWSDIYRFFPRQEVAREPWLEESLCVPIKKSFRTGGFFLTSDGDTPWRQSHEVVEAPEGIRALFPIFSMIDLKSEEPRHRAYLSGAIDAEFREVLVKEFELAKVDEDFLLDVLSERDVLKDKEAEWLLSLFALLGKKYSGLYSWTAKWEQKQFLNRAKECHLIPCEDGSIRRLSEGAVVYRSITELPDFMRGKVLELRQDLYKALNQDIKEEEARERQQFARELIWELVRDAKPENLYEDIIRPAFENAGDAELDEQTCEALDSYVLFLKDKYVLFLKDKNVVRGDVKLRVKGKRAYKKAETLYLATSYLVGTNSLPLYDIERLLADCHDVLFVSPHYLDLATASKEGEKVTGWRDFLTKCGVTAFPKLEHNSVFVAKSKEEFAKKFQEEYHHQPSQLEGSGRPYTGHDRECKQQVGYNNAYRLLDWGFGKDFKAILNKTLETRDQAFFVEFLKMLDCNWEELKQCAYLSYFYTSTIGGKQHIDEKTLYVPSRFVSWLQENEWLPARSLPDRRAELKLPSEVYLLTAETAGIRGGFYIDADSIGKLELRRRLGLRETRPEQAIASSPEESPDTLMEQYGSWAVESPPLDKEKEKFIKKLYQRVNDAIGLREADVVSKFKTHVRQVYDATRSWNELSKVRYFISDVSIINELRDDVKREVMFLPAGLDPDSIKSFLTLLNKHDLLSVTSKTLPSDIKFREEETSHFVDLANGLWSLLKDERAKDELKVQCGEIAAIKAHFTQALCYTLRRETDSISNWIKTDGILLNGVFWFLGDLKDMSVGVAMELCREFSLDKKAKDFIEKVFARSRNSVGKVLIASGREYEVAFKEKPRTLPARVPTRGEEVLTHPDEGAEKDIPVEDVKPIKAELDTIGQITRKPHSPGPSPVGRPSTGHRHTREETGRRGERIMEERILPVMFPDSIIRYVDVSEYDFIVERPDGRITYVEVKSSASDEREFSFEMSEKQKDFAEQQGKKYQLWFLMNAWDVEPRYLGPHEFSALLEMGLLQIQPIRETIYKCTVTVTDISSVGLENSDVSKVPSTGGSASVK